VNIVNLITEKYSHHHIVSAVACLWQNSFSYPGAFSAGQWGPKSGGNNRESEKKERIPALNFMD
jgi:hypothetical protein